MDKVNEVAVLIVLYNCKKELLVLMRSLKAQTFQNFKLYIINNGSKDEYEGLIEKYFKNFYYLDSTENTGFTGGNNLLAQIAIREGCKYLYIINPDMELNPDTVEKLYTLCEENKKIGACNCTILYGRDKSKDEIIQLFGCKANYKTQSKKFLFNGKYLKEVKLPEILEVEYINTGSFFIRSEVVMKIGLFDENFFMYNEEIDIARRVKSAGYKVIVTSRTKIWHHHNWENDNITGYKTMYYYMMRNRYLYFYKYNLHFFLIVDLFWQVISFPFKIKMFYRLKSLEVIRYYYLGILRGILKEKGKTNIIFDRN